MIEQNTLKISALTKALVDQLTSEDMEDGCYDGVGVMAYDRYSGRVFRIIGVATDDDHGVCIVLTEA